MAKRSRVSFNHAFIRKLREVNGFSRSEFAREIGLSGQTVYQIEAGKRVPSVKAIIKIMEVFPAVRVDSFFVIR